MRKTLVIDRCENCLFRKSFLGIRFRCSNPRFKYPADRRVSFRGKIPVGCPLYDAPWHYVPEMDRDRDYDSGAIDVTPRTITLTH